MMPKIKYILDDTLTKVFLPPEKDETSFKKEAKKFIIDFKKIEKRALQKIEEFSGLKWSVKQIPLYVVPNNRMIYSFAKENIKGVVLKMYKKSWGIPILIHELTHINQFGTSFYSKKSPIFKKDGSRDTIKLETYTDLVCISVVRNLFGKNSQYEKDYWDFLENFMSSTPGKARGIKEYIKKWNLTKKSLREYINI